MTLSSRIRDIIHIVLIATLKTDVGVQLNFELLNQKENLEFEKIADFNASIIENSELIDQLPDQFVSKV